MEIIETLYYDKEIKNLKFHINRIKKTYKYFKWKFNDKKWDSDLKEIQNRIQNSPKRRIRITYNQNGIKNTEFFPVKERTFKTFTAVEINFNYFIKKKKRDKFELLKSNFDTDELILIKNNLVTDTTISNLAFFDGKEWLTPKHPLLNGTKREELIQKGVLKETNIHKYDLRYFKKIAMLNAVLGFREIENFDIIL